jgi:hypothetical protein
MSPDEKAGKDEVTINIGMPRPLHRRLSITCAVLDVSLKSALMAGAALWIDENAHAVAKALPQPGDRALAKRGRPASESEPGEEEADKDPPSNGASNGAGRGHRASCGEPRE